MEIILSKTFIKQAKKIGEGKPNIQNRINDCLKSIQNEGKKSLFFRKEMKGSRMGQTELQVGGDIRILARFSKEFEKVVLEEIGTHSFFGW